MQQVKITLDVPRVELPSALVGKNLTFKVHVERIAFTQCGSLEAATGQSSDQVALSDAELANATGDDVLSLEVLVIIGVLVLLLVLGCVAVFLYVRQSNATGSAAFESRSTSSGRSRRASAKSLSSERHSRRAARHALSAASSRRTASRGNVRTMN